MKSGSFVFDTVNRTNVQILDRIEAWGYVSYRVFDPSSGKVYKLAENQLSEDAFSQFSSEKTKNFHHRHLQRTQIRRKNNKKLAQGLFQ